MELYNIAASGNNEIIDGLWFQAVARAFLHALEGERTRLLVWM